MERIFHVRHLDKCEQGRVDRFVFPRESVTEMRRRRSWHGDADTVDIWDPNHHRQNNYKSYLNEVFGMKQRNYQMSSGDIRMKTWPTWPCVPRKKRFLNMADCILDLPSYNFSPFPELLDWSHKNILVAALGRSFHMFGWTEQSVIGKGITQQIINGCKFDPRGECLLLGTEERGVELHDVALNKFLSKRACVCIGDYVCAVTTVDWSPTGNSFVIGCSNGTLCSWTWSGELISNWSGMGGAPILSTRVSPDSRYVAVAALGWSSVHVLLWPQLTQHSILYLHSASANVKTLDWHSWRTALLGVGADTTGFQPRIALWDVPCSKIRETGFGGSARSLDTMLFSHRTGELVLSLWDPNGPSILTTPPDSRSSLVVMSDPDTVVDQSDAKTIMDRVRTMVFSPDGSKIATASETEDLTIWNFLPEDHNKENIKNNIEKRKFHAHPAYIDEVTKGFVIR